MGTTSSEGVGGGDSPKGLILARNGGVLGSTASTILSPMRSRVGGEGRVAIASSARETSR